MEEGRKRKVFREKAGELQILLWEFRTTGFVVFIMVIVTLATSLAHLPRCHWALGTHKLPR